MVRIETDKTAGTKDFLKMRVQFEYFVLFRQPQIYRAIT